MDIEQLFILNVSGVTEKYLGNSYFCYEGGKNIINNIFSDAIVIHCGIFYILILKKKKDRSSVVLSPKCCGSRSELRQPAFPSF